ncbi:MAG: hypothetical protein C5B54_10435 [Acidobacteria bacterium]|nr:MAG: hypothetical protein C5B54_10435 [Acidobacteriota bacterium]
MWIGMADAASYPSSYKQLGFFYKPAVDQSKDTLVKYFDDYVLTRGDESYRDSLKARGISSPFLQYIRFDAIQDPGSCGSRPYHNQVADHYGDFCDISNNHADWFLLDKYGKRMYSDGYVMMDPGSSGWRSFFLSRIKTMQQSYGWSGVFLDNVEASLTKRRQLNQLPKKYTSDSSYQSAVKGMLSYLYSWFHSNGRPAFANIITLETPSVWFTYMSYLDGAMCEAWATGWGNSGWRTTSQWLENLSRAEDTQTKGKRAILVAQGSKSNNSRQQFGYASFLLIDNSKAIFRYGLADSYQYAWTYSNYTVDLGIPLGKRYQSGSNWCRDYSKGKVCVNPSAHTSSITQN